MHQKRPTLRCACGVGDGGALPIDEPGRACPALPPRPDGLVRSSGRGEAPSPRCMNVGERKRPFEGTSGGSQRSAGLPSQHGGVNNAPP